MVSNWVASKLKDYTGRHEVPLEEITGIVCRDVVASLTTRFDMADSLITATSLANKKTWPAKHEDSKGKSLESN